MTRYAIIEYNTDRRDAQYKIEFTRSVRQVQQALDKKAVCAYPYDPTNFHRRVTVVYQLPQGYRKPSKAVLNKSTKPPAWRCAGECVVLAHPGVGYTGN